MQQHNRGSILFWVWLVVWGWMLQPVAAEAGDVASCLNSGSDRPVGRGGLANQHKSAARLVQALGGPDYREAASELFEMKEIAVPALVNGLTADNLRIRRESVKLLGHMGRAEGALPLIDLAQAESTNSALQRYAFQSLGRIATPEAKAFLAGEVRAASDLRRKRALKALTMADSAAAMPFILSDLKRAGARDDAIQMLESLDPAMVQTTLVNVYAGHEPALWAGAALAIGELKLFTAAGDLYPVMVAKNSATRPYGAVALAGLGARFLEPNMLPLFARALADEDRDIRMAAAHALKRMGMVEAVPYLIRSLQTNRGSKAASIEERAAVLNALAQSVRPGSVEALPFFVSALDSDNKSMKEGALHGMFLMGTPETLPHLLRVLAESDPQLKAGALWRLFVMGAPIPMAELVRLALDDNETVREEALAFVVSQQVDFAAFSAQLSPMLSHPQWQMRQRIAQVLGNTGFDAAAGPVRTLLADKHPRVRAAAALALVKTTGMAAMAAIEALLDNGDVVVREGAARALGELVTDFPLAALEKAAADPAPAVRQAARRSMAKLSPLKAVAHLTSALKDPDEANRESAMDLLEEIGSVEATPHLAAMMKGDSESIGAAAVEALGWMAHPKATAAIVKSLDHRAAPVREQACETLQMAGSEALIPRLGRALEDDNPDVRVQAIETLMAIDSAAAHPFIIGALTDADRDVRVEALSAILEARILEATPDLIERLTDKEEKVRAHACFVIGELGIGQALPHMNALLEDNSIDVRDAAGRARCKLLAGKPDASSVDTITSSLGGKPHPHQSPETSWNLRAAIAEVLEEESGDDRERASQLLAAIPEPITIPALMMALHYDAYPNLRKILLQALQQIDRSEVIAQLAAALSHPFPMVRFQAAQTLTGPAAGKAVPQLLRALNDDVRGVREAAALALGHSRSAEAAPALATVLLVDEWYVGIQALRALGEIGDTTAIPSLLSFLENTNATLRLLAVDALGKIKAPSTVAHVLAALDDPSPRVRAMAALALGRMGRPEAIPYLLAQTDAAAVAILRQFDWAWEKAYVIESLYGPLFDRLSIAQVRLAAQRAITNGRDKFDAILRTTAGFQQAAYSTNLAAWVHAVGASPIQRAKIRLLTGIYQRNWQKEVFTPSDIQTATMAMASTFNEPSPFKNPYLLFFNAYVMNEKGFYPGALDWSHKALDAIVEKNEPVLAICLRWLRTEIFWRLGRAQDALVEINHAETNLLSSYNHLQRLIFGHFFAANTVVLKGIVLADLGRTRESLLTFFAAEDALVNDPLQKTDPGDFTSDVMAIASRLKKVILGFRAKVQGQALKQDADQVIGMSEEKHGQTALVRIAEETALEVRIAAAVGEGDYETAHLLTERLALRRHARLGAQSANPLSSGKKATLKHVQMMQAEIKRLDLAAANATLMSRMDSSGAAVLPQAVTVLAAPNGKGATDQASLMIQRRAKQRELKQFMVQLKKSHPEIATLIGAEPVHVGRLQRLLKSDQAIVQYLVMKEKIYIFFITSHAIDVVESLPGRVNIGREVRKFRRGIQQNNPHWIKTAGARLSRLLITPVQSKLRAYDRLILVPNGVLHLLPFGALKLGSRYLVQRHTLTYLSAASLMTLSKPRPSAPRRLMAIANPIHPEWAPLAAAEAEVHAIGAHFKNKEIYTKEHARKDLLKGRDLRGWHLHLSMHATAGSMEETGLVFSDGYLDLQEIWELYLEGAPLVVLSACETSMGEQISGDEVVSLANGFLFSGARRVVSGLWQVPDAGARQLMERFYFQMSTGQSPGHAMAHAQRHMIEKSNWNQPRYWAGFTLNGF